MNKKLLLIIITVIFIGFMFYIFSKNSLENIKYMENVSVNTKNGQEYYVIDEIYKGEYDLQYLDFTQHYAEWYSINAPSSFEWSNLIPANQWHSTIIHDANVDASDIVPFDIEKIATYEEYVDFCKEWGILQKYDNPSKKYIIYSQIAFLPNFTAKLAGIQYIKGSVELYILDYPGVASMGLSGYVYIIPTNKNVNTINRKRMITRENFEKIPEYSIN